jgi:orotidine-5'-phosphate decarboxylase
VSSPTPPGAGPDHFSDRLAGAIDRAGSPVCVGLDPVLDKLPRGVRERASDPVQAIGEFSLGVLNAVHASRVVPAVKFQSACFERFHGRGVALLDDLIAKARGLGLVVVLDAKRGDIGISAEHYGAAAFPENGGADVLTVSGYLGADTVEPFVKPGRGVFVLVRTSNPGSDGVQSHRLADGRTVAEMMADMVAKLGESRRGTRGLSDVGAVVGATKPVDGAALRARMPDQVFLVPGFGAQGGTPDDVRALVRPGARSPGESGVLVTASRSVIYAFDTESPVADWREGVRAAAAKLAGEIAAVVAAR